MSNAITRSDFLKGMAAAGLGVAAFGGLAACSPNGESGGGAQANGSQTAWDEEFDVVVVGSGTGAYAALAALDAGAETVAVLEKGEMWGGTSATSGGGFWIPMAYCATELGVEDNREDAITYMKKVAAGRSTDALIETYVDNANPFLEWTRDLLGFTWGFNNEMFQDYFEPYEGFRAFGRGSVSLVGEMGAGGMWTTLQQKLGEMGAEIKMRTTVSQLITDGEGAVVGVSTEDGTNYHAKKCVVLATGGFDHNKEMRAAYHTMPLYVTCASAGDTGDGQRMGQAIGADLAIMDENWGVPSFLPGPFKEFDPEADIVQDYTVNDWALYRGKPNALVVNRYGKRFGNEAAVYAVFNRSFGQWDSGNLEFTNIPAFFVCDSEYTQYYTLPGQAAPGDPIPEMFVQAETLEELAGILGIDQAGFAAQIEEFNANAAQGADPQFHRGEKQVDQKSSGDYGTRTELANVCLAPIATPPFYGATYVPGTCGTNGGLRINEYAQVLDTAGEPIAGLLAVGNCSASLSGGGYTGGGMTLGAGSVMGWVGVKHALGAS